MDHVAETILCTAIRDFSNSGIEDVTLLEIAFDASIPLTTLNRYYPTKEALLQDMTHYMATHLEHFSMTEEDILAALKEEKPEDILMQFVTSYGWDDNELLEHMYYLLYTEHYTSSVLSQFSYDYLMVQPVHNIQFALDCMVKAKAIPPCDSKAIAEMWCRTAYIFGIIAIQSHIDYNDYYATIKFFISIATKGVQPIPTEQLFLQWKNNSHMAKNSTSSSNIRDKIKNTALALFGAHGYTQVSMNKIAQDLSMDIKDVYRYYRSKSHILKDITSEILDNRYKMPNPAFTANLESHDPLKLILVLSGSFFSVHENEIVKLYKVLFQEQYMNEDLKDFFISSILLDREAVTQNLDQLIEEKKISPCESKKIATAYVFSMCSISAGEALHPEKYEESENIRIRIIAIFVSIILYGYNQ